MNLTPTKQMADADFIRLMAELKEEQLGKGRLL
jgi:hypothetical protein